MLKRTLLTLLLCLSTGYAANTSQRYFTNNGGLINHLSPLLLPETSASAIQNLTLDDRGQLTKRGGYTINNSTGALGPTTWPVTGLGYHSAASGTSFLGVIVGTDVYRTSNSFGGTYSLITGTVTLTNSSSNLAQTASINDVMVVCNEQDQPFKIPPSGNAVALNTVSAPSKVRTCAAYGNYLIIGNTTESSVDFPSRIRWSDINTVDSFPSNNFIDIEPNDGDKIVSLISFEDSVYVFKKHSIYRVIITGLSGADAFIVRPVARGIGAWAKNSVKVVNNVGIAFLGQNTVYMFDGNSFTPIGDNILRSFDALSRATWANAVAGVYPKRSQYWLAVSTNGTTNTEVFVYDYAQQAWTVYTGMNVNALTQADDSVGASLLISADYAGNIYKQDNGTVDMPGNVSTAISASYTTADLTLGSPEITKSFKYIYIFSQVDTVTTLTVNAAYDYQAFYESTASVSLGQVGALYDTAIYDTDLFPGLLYKVTRLELNRSSRAIKLNFVNSDSTGIFGVIGWVLVSSPEDYKQ